MIAVARLLYAQRWNDLTLPTMKEWLMKVTEFVEMNKLTSLITEKILSKFICDWNPFMDFFGKNLKDTDLQF